MLSLRNQDWLWQSLGSYPYWFFTLNNHHIKSILSLVSIDLNFFIISNEIILWLGTVTQDNSYLFIAYQQQEQLL